MGIVFGGGFVTGRATDGSDSRLSGVCGFAGAVVIVQVVELPFGHVRRSRAATGANVPGQAQLDGIDRVAGAAAALTRPRLDLLASEIGDERRVVGDRLSLLDNPFEAVTGRQTTGVERAFTQFARRARLALFPLLAWITLFALLTLLPLLAWLALVARFSLFTAGPLVSRRARGAVLAVFATAAHP